MWSDAKSSIESVFDRIESAGSGEGPLLQDEEIATDANFPLPPLSDAGNTAEEGIEEFSEAEFEEPQAKLPPGVATAATEPPSPADPPPLFDDQLQEAVEALTAELPAAPAVAPVDDAEEFAAFESSSSGSQFDEVSLSARFDEGSLSDAINAVGQEAELGDLESFEAVAAGHQTSVSRLREAYEPDRPTASIEITMPGLAAVEFEELGDISSEGGVFDDASSHKKKKKRTRRLAERLKEEKLAAESPRDDDPSEHVVATFSATDGPRPSEANADDLDELRIEFTMPGAPKEPRDPTWTVDTRVTGRIDLDLTQEVWRAERLPYGQEHAVPVVGDREVFEIERELASGKHGTVYLGTLEDREEPVALKILSSQLSQSLHERQRFRREIRSHASLAHPNIVQVLKYGRRQGRYFLATELMQGSLRDIIRHVGILPTAIIALIIEDLLKGIQYAHLRQVVHREIKPSNLLFSDGGILKIGDFGFAKSSLDPNQSAPGVSLGTTAYMSPEQATGDRVGPRSDLFSIGTLIYELCARTNPYDLGNDIDNMLAVRRAEVPELCFVRPDAHPHVSSLVRDLHSPNKNDRPESAYEALKRIWPLARMVQKRYPKVRGQFVRSPKKIARQLRKDEAKLEVQRAERILENGDARAPAGFLAFLRAWAVDKDNTTARKRLIEMQETYGFHFDRDWPERMGTRIREPLPSDPEEWREKANEARTRGDVWDLYRYLRCYTRHRPLDHVSNRTLEELYDERPLAPFDRGKKREDETPPEVGHQDRVYRPGPTLRVALPGLR